MNPCHGPLVRSVGTVGLGQITERVRSTLTFPQTATDINGYVVWFPSYHNPNSGDGYPANYFVFTNSLTSTAPLNNSTNPLGTIAENTTGLFYADPASPTVATSSAFSRARSLAACLQVEYLGALSSASGQVAVISNFSFNAFNRGGATSTTITAPTVDQLFSYAHDRKRLQMTGHEVVWRPSDAQSVFRGSGTFAGTATDLRADAIMRRGTATANTTVVCSTQPADIYGICIAWRGVPPTALCMSINAVKVVDCELAPSGNNIEPTYVSAEAPVTGVLGSTISSITNYLDSYVPNWQSRAVNATIGVAGDLAMAYAPALLPGTASRGVLGRSNPFYERHPRPLMPPPTMP